MKRFASIMSTLTLAVTLSSTAFAGNIVGARTSRTGTIVGARTGNIVGARTGNITGARTGSISVVPDSTKSGFDFDALVSEHIVDIIRFIIQTGLF